MIKTRHLEHCFVPLKCDSCGRTMPWVTQFEVITDRSHNCEVIELCEDCSNALVELFHNTMEEGKTFKYEEDEIKEMEEL